MIKEKLKELFKFGTTSPSEEFLHYVDNIWGGTNKDIPTYGQRRKGIFDYYGKDKQGYENARFRIPWGEHQEIEKSFHIKKEPNGKFVVTDEGFYLNKK